MTLSIKLIRPKRPILLNCNSMGIPWITALLLYHYKTLSGNSFTKEILYLLKKQEILLMYRYSQATVYSDFIDLFYKLVN